MLRKVPQRERDRLLGLEMIANLDGFIVPLEKVLFTIKHKSSLKKHVLFFNVCW